MDGYINLICCLTGIMLFSYWLNYVMGTPLADEPKHVDTGAFLFDWPLAMARRRLRQYGKLDAIRAELKEDLTHTKDPAKKRELRRDARLNMVIEGRKLFSYEKALLCQVCLHWWLTVIFVAGDLTFDIFHTREYFGTALLTYLVNHFFIRKI
jgi:hypothetical protein